MRRGRLLIVFGSLLAAGGCQSEPASIPPPAIRTPPASRPTHEDDATRAMRPFLGKWRANVDETALASKGVPDEVLSDMLLDLQRHPFTLEITRDRYVSVSDVKTVVDEYEPYGYEDSGAIVISLRSINGAESDAHPRRSRLLLRNRQLLIGRDAGLIVVMTRISP